MQTILQAIITKTIPATNYRPKRIKASCDELTRMYQWYNHLTPHENHVNACNRLRNDITDLDRGMSAGECHVWMQPMASGQLPSGEYAHVFLPQQA